MRKTLLVSQNINELSRAGLAEYVIRRKAIIDLLGKALEVEPSGSYSLESRIHSIICPMQVSSDEIKLDDGTFSDRYEGR